MPWGILWNSCAIPTLRGTTAVLAFAVGVALAAVLLRRREQERRRARRDETPDASLPEDRLAMAAGGQNEEKKPDMPEDHTPKE